MVPRAAANNGDGNIIGQTFDFIGNPIRAVCGQFSNLGQLCVNNDDQTLFLGLSGVMITRTQNVVLFLGLPRAAGVTTLGELQADSAGADAGEVAGLRFWENLLFTNFTPSVACILGDKFGDSQDRGFGRFPGVKTGQGVFQLRPGLPSVEGVRLQQFNLSPQVYGVPGASNANFIEVAIPFSELGGLHPGDTIQIAVVAAGVEATTNSMMGQRWLDIGYLGASLVGGGWGAARLEGSPVQLARAPVPAELDSDADGLRDNWEMAHGLDRFSAVGLEGAQADRDRDGMSNWEEQAAGTDPNDASAWLRLSVAGTANRGVEFSWEAVVGKHYQLEYSEAAAGQFTPLLDPSFPRLAQQLLERFTQDVSQATGPAAARFYRLRVLP